MPMPTRLAALSIALACAGFVGCAARPEPAAEPMTTAVAAPAAPAAAAAAAAAPESAASSAAEGERRAGLVCRHVKPTGSNRPQRVCVTAEEDRASRERAREILQPRAPRVPTTGG